MTLDKLIKMCYTIFNRLVKCKEDGVGIQKTIKAISDPHRREILSLLKSGRLSAGEISERFSISGAAVSKHLAILRDADMIRDTREGKYIYYELNTSVLDEVIIWLGTLGGKKDD